MKKLFFSIIGILCVVIVHSQEKTTKTSEVDELIDELFEEESFDELLASLTNFQFLYVSVNYSSDTYFSGRDIGIDQFNITPQITYMHSKGFYASVSSSIYSEFEPKWDVTVGTLGYGKSFGKDNIFRYNGSLSKYLYTENNVDGLYKGSANFGLSVKNKKRNIGTQLSGSYYFGGESTFQIVSRSFVNFNLLKTKKHHLKFRPQMSFVTGTQLVNISSSLPNEEDEFTLGSSDFSLIYTQFNFPLQYNVKSFDFELGYNFNIPSSIENESVGDNTSFFNFGIAYMIDL